MEKEGKERRENKIWEIINRERQRRKKINERIGLEEWGKYFAGLFQRVE